MMPTQKRLLVWGGGAIGGTVAAYLGRAGHDVTVVDIEAEHVAAVSRQGMAISGPIETFTAPLAAFVPEELQGQWEIVLLAVKGHHTADACGAIKPHLVPSGYVVSLQNGLCEDVIAAIVGRDRTIGCFVNFAADWLAPGSVRFGQWGVMALGELDGRITPRLRELVALMQDFDPNAIATDDVEAYLWGKLGFATMLYVTTVAHSPMVVLLERADLLPIWRAACGETMAVARARGIVPRGFDGFEPDAFMPGATEAAAKASVEGMLTVLRPSSKTHSGMWRDIAIRKRKTEVDVQLVPVVEMGEAAGVPCPTLRRLVDQIHALERGTALQTDDAPLALA